ncbi:MULTISPECIES: Y-family DNA polymerase [Pseudomonas]|uniref:Y-family DNA polymerase n=1 Tax=Pseudomonas TaxID=286 RepID=UPI00053E7CB7|nr:MULTISPECIES: DNA polymerase Y family protein [Pseudomonas]EKL0659829.1 DNA polymerase Y family protein [Pseudomonas aeruginosa]EKL8242346.1 DNA polymerase Y family protein [Pseudomonas aeruginosa]EKL8600664.1 DNA polymerase Y family protein [Pseudomonas aeruginosa]EKP5709811.1 DNA polymerase Y family protein [Pseudomonas aeruginosa]EKT0600642.1 DNA polymerase Y family protein [Pseudomonas aeruginosa]
MLWACILLPQLAMDSALRQRSNPDAPLALLGGPVQRRQLQAVNPAARALGLKPGQSLIAAQALSRDFATAEYDLAAVERWQAFLAAWAYGFSSQVSLHYPRALLLEVQSSLALFGPWPRFEARLRKELTALGFRHRLCLAPNPVAARVLANSHDGLAIEDETALQRQLSALPLDRLGLSRELAVALGRMGLRHLRQVLELPRAALARRFPAELLLHIDRLCGRSPLALEHYRPPDTFDLRIELNFDVESHQALLFPLRRLSADLAAFLAGRDSGVQRFTLHLEHHGRADSQVTVGLLSAEREAAMLFELTRGRLEQLQLPAPVHAVRLEARELPPFTPQHRELFDERPQQYLGWEQLRERLRARLGDEAVQGLSAVAEHRPERSWRPHSCDRAQSPAACGLRPGWLLAEPRPLSEALPTVLAGPERIESGWWDGEDIRRDYYLVETRSGQRAWVYREVGSEGPLWLHGWFA